MAAVGGDDRGHDPAICQFPDDPVLAVEVVGLPHHRSGHHVAPVLIGALLLLEILVVEIEDDVVERRSVEVAAGQGMAPGVASLGTDAVSETLLNGDLQSVVVRALIGLNVVDV